MKFLVALALVACVQSAWSVPVSDEQTAEIVVNENDVRPEGYKYVYQTSNGISAESEGHVEDVNSEYPRQVVRGSYSYTGPDGQTYLVTYTADENGFHPQGDHLPVAPEVPRDIQRSLAYTSARVGQEVVRTAPIVPVAAPVPVVVDVAQRVSTPVVTAKASAGFPGFPNNGFVQKNTQRNFGRF